MGYDCDVSAAHMMRKLFLHSGTTAFHVTLSNITSSLVQPCSTPVVVLDGMASVLQGRKNRLLFHPLVLAVLYSPLMGREPL